MSDHSQRIALTTYSVKPRGGVVHTLELAEALQEAGIDVTVIAMGEPEKGFFREVSIPYVIIKTPEWVDSLEDRVFGWIDAMEAGLKELGNKFDIVHSQDCISARAAARVRDAGANFRLIRTVHHVDDFTTQALIDCQKNAILEPDDVFVVSKLWQDQLLTDYGVNSSIVTNGVHADRFSTPLSLQRYNELRTRVGIDTTDNIQQFLFLTVGGIEPRKGSRYLIDAFSQLKKNETMSPSPILAIIGGHSFQDYTKYKEDVLNSLPELGLELGKDVILLGTVDDNEFPEWFGAADAFVFPSINEGWGLVVLEAAAASLPIVTSDIDVFHEFLEHDKTAILTKAKDAVSLEKGMKRLLHEPETVSTLMHNGPALANKYSWTATADQHIKLYNK